MCERSEVIIKQLCSRQKMKPLVLFQLVMNLGAAVIVKMSVCLSQLIEITFCLQ